MLAALLISLLVLPWLVNARSSLPGRRALPALRWTTAPAAAPHRTPTDADDWIGPGLRPMGV